MFVRRLAREKRCFGQKYYVNQKIIPNLIEKVNFPRPCAQMRFLSTENDYVEFSNLSEMQAKACVAYAPKQALGTWKDSKFQWLTYAELGVEVDKFRTILSEKFKITKGDKVSLISNNRVEWPICFYATVSLGAQVVPMYAIYPSLIF